MKSNGESEYDFALILTGISEVTDEIAGAIYQAGCDDATVSVRSGRVYVTFSRRASSMKDAVLSAIHDIQSANVVAEVLRVDECNLVTQAEIARRSGRSRQVIHQYIAGDRGPGGFPSPACNLCDDSQLWYWCEVSCWLWENNMIKEDVLRNAEEVEIINAVLEFRRLQQREPELTLKIMQAVEA